MAREGLAEKVAFEQRLKEMRERERDRAIRKACNKSKGNHRSKSPEQERAWGVQRQQRDQCGWREDTQLGQVTESNHATELQLDSVRMKHLGKVLNRGVAGSDLFMFNRMPLAVLLGRVFK